MNKPIRVLHVCQRMEAAGVQSFIMNMYRNIDRENVQFDFLVHYKEKQFYEDEIAMLGGKIYKLSVREDYNIIKYFKELNCFFKTHKYDIVHGHMDSLGAIYLGAAKWNGVPVRIAHAHTDFVQDGIKKIPRHIMISLYKMNANQLFACSHHSGKFMFKNQKFEIYRNAIDVKMFAYDEKKRKVIREKLSLCDELVIGNVGRFHVVKNQEFILDIVGEIKKRINKVMLLLIGSGELEEQLVAKIKSLDLEGNVMLLKERKDINEIYQAMDIFVLPSLFEGIPLVGIEAQASGLPCLFSDRINREVAITSNNYFLSIDNGVNLWVEKIIEVEKNIRRRDETDSICISGYYSKDVAKRLENYYLSIN